MRRSLLRFTAASLLVLAASLGGCGAEGGKGSGAPRLELVVCELDGEPPREGLEVERVQGQALSGQRLPVKPVAGERRLFEVPGASNGSYYLHMPEGWGLLVLNSMPRLEAGGLPARCRIGRAHTIYLDSHQRARLLGDVWGANKPLPTGGLGPPVPLKVERDPSGVTVVRVPPEQWEGPIALMGRYADGGLTELMLAELKAAGRPVYRELDPEPLAPLIVSVASREPLADDALWAHVSALGLPIEDHQQQPLRAGSALFRGVPAGGSGIEVRLGDGAEAPRVRVEPGGWFGEGELRLAEPPRAPVTVALAGVKPGPRLRVQARPEEGDSYGLVPLVAGEPPDVASVRLDPGRWRLLIEEGDTLRRRTIQVESGGKVSVLDDPPPEPPAIVKGELTVGEGRRLFWRREEEGRMVLGQGFVLRAGAGGRYQGRLPAGTYELIVEDIHRQPGKPKKVVLTPGMQLSLSLGD